MSVLVTGVTGFVGGAVARALLAAEREVVGLVRASTQAGLPAGLWQVSGDMTAPETYRHLVDKVDAVIHTAQLRTGARLTPRAMDRLNAADRLMTTTLAQACLTAGKRFIYTGGCFNYGDHGADWIDETTPLAPSPLAVGKAAAVARLRGLHRRGLDVVVISPGFVYGPGGNFKTAFVDMARKGRLRCIGAGQNYWSPVHVDDLATAYVAALEHAPAGQEYNVVDDAPLPLRSFVDHITDAMGQPRVGSAPPLLVALLAGRPAVVSLITSYRVRNDKIRALDWTPRYPRLADGLPPSLAALPTSRRS